jgi:hypothetical protein
VGVQVAVEPGEQRELRGSHERVLGGGIDRDHPARLEVPEVTWCPPRRPLPEAERAGEPPRETVGDEPQENAGTGLQVAGHADEERTQNGHTAPGDVVRDGDRAGESVGASHQRRVEAREPQVVREPAAGVGQRPQEHGEHVAAVVVADRFAGEPGVLGGERRGAFERPHEAEVEELLADCQRERRRGRVYGPHESDEQESNNKNSRRLGEPPPLGVDAPRGSVRPGGESGDAGDNSRPTERDLTDEVADDPENGEGERERQRGVREVGE